MPYRPALNENELPPGTLRTVEIDGRKILLVRRDDGIYATTPRCPHMGLPLDKGELTPRANCAASSTMPASTPRTAVSASGPTSPRASSW